MSEHSENPKVLRRLAAILAADIAGYSALIGADEARTVRDLKDHLAVVLPMVSGHGGRVIDTAGDGILAEFVCYCAVRRPLKGGTLRLPGPRCLKQRRHAQQALVFIAATDELDGHR